MIVAANFDDEDGHVKLPLVKTYPLQDCYLPFQVEQNELLVNISAAPAAS
jgi:hypothetical protein